MSRFHRVLFDYEFVIFTISHNFLFLFFWNNFQFGYIALQVQKKKINSNQPIFKSYQIKPTLDFC